MCYGLHTGNAAACQPATRVAFPSRHRGDVRLDRRISVGFGDLGIAAREEARGRFLVVTRCFGPWIPAYAGMTLVNSSTGSPS
jgi:hypothetical protein